MSQIDALRAALLVSPDNVPLRQVLAETLLQQGRADEAEVEFRAALALDRDSAALQLGLARAYFQQEKASQAMVVVESLVKRRDVPPAAYLLQARLHWKRGEVADAVARYRQAVEADGSLADRDFADLLGIDAEPESAVSEGRVRAGGGEDDGPRVEAERPRIKFADVGGMDAVKEEIRMKIILPIQHAEMFAAYGKQAGGGLLMYGPPGCGKTHLARATAGEIKADFLAVGINDVLDMWIGNSERNLHELFEQARRSAPCVLFFDEVDALGASRSDMKNSGGRHLINQFLAEMDGVGAKNDGVLVLAATNAPWHVDVAFRRPGRFDRLLFVPPPDEPARAGIVELLCRGKPLGAIDYVQVARKTPDFSGADLKALVDVTVEAKLRDALKTGKPQPLVTADLLAAARQLKPTTKEWFATARNYALYANQGGLYDDVLKHLKMT